MSMPSSWNSVAGFAPLVVIAGRLPVNEVWISRRVTFRTAVDFFIVCVSHCWATDNSLLLLCAPRIHRGDKQRQKIGYFYNAA